MRSDAAAESCITALDRNAPVKELLNAYATAGLSRYMPLVVNSHKAEDLEHMVSKVGLAVSKQIEESLRKSPRKPTPLVEDKTFQHYMALRLQQVEGRQMAEKVLELDSTLRAAFSLFITTSVEAHYLEKAENIASPTQFAVDHAALTRLEETAFTVLLLASKELDAAAESVSQYSGVKVELHCIPLESFQNRDYLYDSELAEVSLGIAENPQARIRTMLTAGASYLGNCTHAVQHTAAARSSHLVVATIRRNVTAAIARINSVVDCIDNFSACTNAFARGEPLTKNSPTADRGRQRRRASSSPVQKTLTKTGSFRPVAADIASAALVGGYGSFMGGSSDKDRSVSPIAIVSPKDATIGAGSRVYSPATAATAAARWIEGNKSSLDNGLSETHRRELSAQSRLPERAVHAEYLRLRREARETLNAIAEEGTFSSGNTADNGSVVLSARKSSPGRARSFSPSSIRSGASFSRTNGSSRGISLERKESLFKQEQRALKIAQKEALWANAASTMPFSSDLDSTASHIFPISECSDSIEGQDSGVVPGSTALHPVPSQILLDHNSVLEQRINESLSNGNAHASSPLMRRMLSMRQGSPAHALSPSRLIGSAAGRSMKGPSSAAVEALERKTIVNDPALYAKVLDNESNLRKHGIGRLPSAAFLQATGSVPGGSLAELDAYSSTLNTRGETPTIPHFEGIASVASRRSRSLSSSRSLGAAALQAALRSPSHPDTSTSTPTPSSPARPPLSRPPVSPAPTPSNGYVNATGGSAKVASPSTPPAPPSSSRTKVPSPASMANSTNNGSVIKSPRPESLNGGSKQVYGAGADLFAAVMAGSAPGRPRIGIQVEPGTRQVRQAAAQANSRGNANVNVNGRRRPNRNAVEARRGLGEKPMPSLATQSVYSSAYQLDGDPDDPDYDILHRDMQNYDWKRHEEELERRRGLSSPGDGELDGFVQNISNVNSATNTTASNSLDVDIPQEETFKGGSSRLSAPPSPATASPIASAHSHNASNAGFSASRAALKVTQYDNEGSGTPGRTSYESGDSILRSESPKRSGLSLLNEILSPDTVGAGVVGLGASRLDPIPTITEADTESSSRSARSDNISPHAGIINLTSGNAVAVSTTKESSSKEGDSDFSWGGVAGTGATSPNDLSAIYHSNTGNIGPGMEDLCSNSNSNYKTINNNDNTNDTDNKDEGKENNIEIHQTTTSGSISPLSEVSNMYSMTPSLSRADGDSVKLSSDAETENNTGEQESRERILAYLHSSNSNSSVVNESSLASSPVRANQFLPSSSEVQESPRGVIVSMLRQGTHSATDCDNSPRDSVASISDFAVGSGGSPSANLSTSRSSADGSPPVSGNSPLIPRSPVQLRLQNRYAPLSSSSDVRDSDEITLTLSPSGSFSIPASQGIRKETVQGGQRKDLTEEEISSRLNALPSVPESVVASLPASRVGTGSDVQKEISAALAANGLGRGYSGYGSLVRARSTRHLGQTTLSLPQSASSSRPVSISVKDYPSSRMGSSNSARNLLEPVSPREGMTARYKRTLDSSRALPASPTASEGDEDETQVQSNVVPNIAVNLLTTENDNDSIDQDPLVNGVVTTAKDSVLHLSFRSPSALPQNSANSSAPRQEIISSSPEVLEAAVDSAHVVSETPSAAASSVGVKAATLPSVFRARVSIMQKLRPSTPSKLGTRSSPSQSPAPKAFVDHVHDNISAARNSPRLRRSSLHDVPVSAEPLLFDARNPKVDGSYIAFGKTMRSPGNTSSRGVGVSSSPAFLTTTTANNNRNISNIVSTASFPTQNDSVQEVVFQDGGWDEAPRVSRGSSSVSARRSTSSSRAKHANLSPSQLPLLPESSSHSGSSPGSTSLAHLSPAVPTVPVGFEPTQSPYHTISQSISSQTPRSNLGTASVLLATPPPQRRRPSHNKQTQAASRSPFTTPVNARRRPSSLKAKKIADQSQLSSLGDNDRLNSSMSALEQLASLDLSAIQLIP